MDMKIITIWSEYLKPYKCLWKNYYYYYYYTPGEFFTPVLTGGLSLEAERQQVSLVPTALSVGAVEYTTCILPNECPKYDIKQSDGEAPLKLELWGMCSTPSLP